MGNLQKYISQAGFEFASKRALSHSLRSTTKSQAKPLTDSPSHPNKMLCLNLSDPGSNPHQTESSISADLILIDLGIISGSTHRDSVQWEISNLGHYKELLHSLKVLETNLGRTSALEKESTQGQLHSTYVKNCQNLCRNGLDLGYLLLTNQTFPSEENLETFDLKPAKFYLQKSLFKTIQLPNPESFNFKPGEVKYYHGMLTSKFPTPDGYGKLLKKDSKTIKFEGIFTQGQINGLGTEYSDSTQVNCKIFLVELNVC